LKVVIIGGAGFLGYFLCGALMAAGHRPVAVGLTIPAPGSMPEGCETVVLDCDRCSETELDCLLAGADVLVHAAGADGRNSFPAPAIDGFRAANVDPMRRLLPAMRRAGVRRLVIFGSYYTALDRQLPHLGIVQGNAYPASRREQAELAIELAGDSIDVAILELPYIFGAAPGRGTLWGYLIEKVAGPGPVAVPAGGTACITAAQVAAAAVGAIERPNRGHRRFPLAGGNLTYLQI
jgi:dihydroflavonol-4-reductase